MDLKTIINKITKFIYKYLFFIILLIIVFYIFILYFYWDDIIHFLYDEYIAKAQDEQDEYVTYYHFWEWKTIINERFATNESSVNYINYLYNLIKRYIFLNAYCDKDFFKKFIIWKYAYYYNSYSHKFFRKFWKSEFWKSVKKCEFSKIFK